MFIIRLPPVGSAAFYCVYHPGIHEIKMSTHKKMNKHSRGRKKWFEKNYYYLLAALKMFEKC